MTTPTGVHLVGSVQDRRLYTRRPLAPNARWRDRSAVQLDRLAVCRVLRQPYFRDRGGRAGRLSTVTPGCVRKSAALTEDSFSRLGCADAAIARSVSGEPADTAGAGVLFRGFDRSGSGRDCVRIGDDIGTDRDH